MRVLERRHARHQPFRCQRRRGADDQQFIAPRPLQPRRGLAQILERSTHRGQIALRLPRQRQAAIAPFEQANAELFLQPADLMADRGLRHVQLVGGKGEAEMARRRLERAQSVEGGKRRHAVSLIHDMTSCEA